DLMIGEAGSDELRGGLGVDTLMGGEGADLLDGGEDNDDLSGNGGGDELVGGAGNDRLDGGDGADALFGSDGTDDLTGAAGDDAHNGGNGVDTAHFAGEYLDYEIQLDAAGTSTVRDLRPTVDGDEGLDSLVNVERLEFRNITILNDGSNHAPIVTSNGGNSSFAVLVPENTVGVTVVHAIDFDINTTITYSISGGTDAALFTIDPQTGVLAFANAPDFEAPADSDHNNSYSVFVQASDGQLTDAQAITVLVQDVGEFDTTASSPTLTVQPAHGSEDSAIPLSIAAALTDTDGSESLEIRIEGMPVGATLSAGVNQGGGVWSLTATQLTNLTLAPRPDSDADFTLNVRAIATERNGGGLGHPARPGRLGVRRRRRHRAHQRGARLDDRDSGVGADAQRRARTRGRGNPRFERWHRERDTDRRRRRDPVHRSRARERRIHLRTLSLPREPARLGHRDVGCWRDNHRHGRGR